MRLSLRFIVPLLVVLGAIAYTVVPLVDAFTLRWFVRDLDSRATLIATTVQEPLQDAVRARDRVAEPSGRLLKTPDGPLLVSVRPVTVDGALAGRLVLVHDMSFIARRSEETRKYLFYFFVALGAVISLLTVVVAQLSWRGWVQGLRAVLRGEGLWRPAEGLAAPAELQPIVGDLRDLIHDLQEEHRARDEEQLAWTPETLRAILHDDLRGQEVIVVSNREPYIHVRRDGAVAVWRPASGVVTALEPIMRACSGTWVAHGSGSADRDVVDAQDRIAVPPPPERPAYRLRRVWLSAEAEAGYYYGFANEGLWPLCHIAHVRPIFRTADWEQYVKVNRTFTRAVLDESQSPDPIVLVQDFHLALLPRMIREALAGANILGFHTQFHCNNFVDTVDRVLEARVDRELFTVSYRGTVTAVKRYPISVEWPPPRGLVATPVAACRRNVRERHGLPPDHRVGVGVDRLDYTKGIEERLRAVERLFELRPDWVGRFTFIQIGAPTRSRIEQYQQY